MNGLKLRDRVFLKMEKKHYRVLHSAFLRYTFEQLSCCLLSGLPANGDCSALTSKTCSNLLNDDTYWCVCVGRQIEQGAHYIRKSLIYL